MEKSSAIHTAELLESSSGVGYTIGTDLFVGKMPNMPVNCITVLDTGGKPPIDTLDNTNYEQPSTQILVRNSNYEDCWQNAYEIVNFLHNKINFEKGNVKYKLVKLKSNPSFIGYDKHNRPVISINFDIIRVS